MSSNYRFTRGSRKVLVVLTLLSLFLTAARPADVFPEVIPLPNGFQPEGIAIGPGTTFYVGSIPTGAIYRGDLRTGEGEILVPGQEGRQATGLDIDLRTNLLYVSGAMTGDAFVYDATTGENVATIQLTDESTTFINDVVVTQDAVYFTDSFRPVYYRIPLDSNGELPDPIVVEEIPLSGDFIFVPGGFNANGITATPDGGTLIIVSSAQSSLYRVDPLTGEADLIDLGGDSVPNGDGILLLGKTLYVVQNFLNQVAVIELDPDLDSGVIVDTITSEFFRIPTTIARFGNALYAVNARFDTPPTPDTEYEVVRILR